MEHKTVDVDSEDGSFNGRTNHGMWPLDEVIPKKAKFPCCIVWTPLPIVSWLAPFIGHVGICQEDGTVLDFAGSNFMNIDNFSYGAVARYLQLERKKCCFPPNLSSHTCKQSYRHAERGTSISWDDALNTCMQQYHHKYFNMFTCNSHSFVANCLNRLAYNGHLQWNVLNLMALILLKAQWVDIMSILRSFYPFAIVLCFGMFMAGWSFLIGLVSFSTLLVGWFFLGTYCVKNLVE
ncbi:Protein reversion to ethylene sensitivity 1 [Apostasia shenzhenica]|uniref:Protein reversion to ethylene sensitivity 1 n=1 Tax=Apostasia shenzhenica TaxID=1088818 RepID=A0A2I0AP26_9ASPA|nr:Protein reversion to ethylene sensitivity 1 [Apostasia shenzhenica]